MAVSATTWSFLVTPGQQIACRSGNTYIADANGLISGVPIGDVRDIDTAGGINLGLGGNSGAAWNVESGLATIAAFGATQGNATPVTAERVVVTCTASSEGVKLVLTATGGETAIVVPGTKGVKVYPPANCLIDALSTNTAVALVAGKGSIFMQISGTKFVTKVKGA